MHVDLGRYPPRPSSVLLETPHTAQYEADLHFVDLRQPS